MTLRTAIFLWIFAVNIGALIFLEGSVLQAWPMYLACIFFLLEGGTLRHALHAFGGGMFGMVCALALALGLNKMAPTLGLLGALAILLFIILGVIIVGGGIAPVVLNNTAFGYLTVCTIHIEEVPARFGDWIFMLIVGGLIINAGLFAIEKGLGLYLAKKAARKAMPADTQANL
jgi:hypothetical protein